MTDVETVAGNLREVLPLKKTEARVLAVLVMHFGENLTSRQIERIADLRQPEVSNALKSLSWKYKDCILATRSAEKKGRPVVLYVIGYPTSKAFEQMIETAIAKRQGKEVKALVAIRHAIAEGVA